ncbi:MAG: tyrosine-protein phosphatase [Clostridia bacterium]|nr:tyrosine-protein phosphatase [Clostridia bacterium]
MKNKPNNFRDMGGLACQNGKTIKQGKLIRCASLFDLSDEGKKMLDGLHIDTVLDLRSDEEVANKPDYIPKGSTYTHLPVFDNKEFDLVVVSKKQTDRVLALKGEGIDEMRRQKYMVYASMPFANKPWTHLFSCLDKGETILFHCSEGKDRTGMAAAVIEYCLGRTLPQIEEQYLLSNEYVKWHNRKTQFLLRLLGKEKRLREVIQFCETVDIHQFNAAFTAAVKNYADFDVFLLKEYNITEERKLQWQTLYLN